MGYSLWGRKELDMTEQLTHTHTHTREVILHCGFFVCMWVINILTLFFEFLFKNFYFILEYSWFTMLC